MIAKRALKNLSFISTTSGDDYGDDGACGGAYSTCLQIQ
jgi:hypothetical protein